MPTWKKHCFLLVRTLIFASDNRFDMRVVSRETFAGYFQLMRTKREDALWKMLSVAFTGAWNLFNFKSLLESYSIWNAQRIPTNFRSFGWKVHFSSNSKHFSKSSSSNLVTPCWKKADSFFRWHDDQNFSEQFWEESVIKWLTSRIELVIWNKIRAENIAGILIWMRIDNNKKFEKCPFYM